MTIRNFVTGLLADRGKPTAFADSDPLFTSGLLDSMAATELMLHLEAEHGFDLADPDFDIARLDTIDELNGMLTEAA